MADLRTSFMILEDVSTQAGVPLHKILEGDAAAAKNAHPAIVAKDTAGNLIYLRTDLSGNLLVTNDGGGVKQNARGTATGSTSVTTVYDITLVAGEVYKGLSWVVSCFRDAIYEIVHIDDPTGTPVETILADVLVGSGDLTDSGANGDIEFTAGATDPVLRLRAKNLTVASDFRGTIATRQDVATP